MIFQNFVFPINLNFSQLPSSKLYNDLLLVIVMCVLSVGGILMCGSIVMILVEGEDSL
jgi:hypothetical protein